MNRNSKMFLYVCAFCIGTVENFPYSIALKDPINALNSTFLIDQILSGIKCLYQMKRNKNPEILGSTLKKLAFFAGHSAKALTSPDS